MKTTVVSLLLTLSILFPKGSRAATTVVESVGELIDANGSARLGDTIVLENGTYRIPSYGIAVRTDGLTFRSRSGEREKVIVCGTGMQGDIEYGFWVAADNVTITGMTIQEVFYHCIQTDVNTDGLRVIDCVLRDAREQLLKVPYRDGLDDPSENGLVEGCLFEFTGGVAAQYYTGGVDCHFAKNWIVRGNVFRFIRSPDGTIAEHAVHFWTRSESTLVENNAIVDCDRGIGFGMGDSPHRGGTIRNNMILHSALSGNDRGDVGIGLESCAGTIVCNNTVFFDNEYPNAIEYRFASTTGVVIVNNCSNRAVSRRDGASGRVENNVTDAQSGWFRSVAGADLHILPSATALIDRGIAVEGLLLDFDGEARPSGSIDIGADEYHEAGVRGIKTGICPRPAERSRFLCFHTHGGMTVLRTLDPGLSKFGIIDPLGRVMRGPGVRVRSRPFP